jgi:cytochrome c-type biogenesis protein CcmH
MRRAALLAFALLALLTPAAALGITPKTSLTDVEDEVMCVSCNVSLNVAESPQANATRDEIRRLIAQGLTKQQIKDRLVAEYGDRVLALPQTKGFSLAAYLVPIAVGIGLLVLLAVMIPLWRRRSRRDGSDDGDDVVVPLADADARRLDAELARFDS